MAKQVKRRRGTAAEHAVFTTGAHGELTVSLPDDPVSSADKTSNPAEIYVHYGDSAVGERFISRAATIDLIREQLDRQVFLARITGHTAMGTRNVDEDAADSGTNENRWVYEWEEVAIRTPIAHQVKLSFTFGSGTWGSNDVITTFKLPVTLYGTNAGENQAVMNATTSPAYDTDLVDFSLKLDHGLDGGSIDDTTKGTFLQNWASAWNAIAQSSSTATGVGTITSNTSTIRFHTATVETSTNSIILTRDVPENVNIPHADYQSAGLAVTNTDSNVTNISMTIVSGEYNPQLTSGDWSGTLPTLDGLFMQYGATTQTPAINATQARTWKSVDPTDGGTNNGYFYALNTAEMPNFYVSSDSGAATDGYGVMGAGMSLTDANNDTAGHDTAHVREITSQKTSSTTTTSKLYAKRQFPQNYSIEPIMPGTIVVMHERWTASTSGEANYSGLFPPGGISAGSNYQGSVPTGSSPSIGKDSSGTMYTPSPPFYYFSMPNVTQGLCG
jgi:hypothetical protein